MPMAPNPNVVTGTAASVDDAGCAVSVLFCVILGTGAGALVVSAVNSLSTCFVQPSKSKNPYISVVDSVSLICNSRVPLNHSCWAGVGIWINSSSFETTDIREELSCLVDIVVFISGLSRDAFCIAYDS